MNPANEKRLAAEDIIRLLQLEPLPEEGGMFRSTYRTEQMAEGRNMGSAIYYFLADNAFSHLHRLATDEVYHFYYGDPVELVELMPDGSFHTVILGTDIMNGQHLQYVVKAGSWQGSRLAAGGEYAIMGTTMSPGYAAGDYEHGVREKLVYRYPGAKNLIEQLTGELIYK